VATGADFADALAATPYLGKTGSPLLLVGATGGLPTPVLSYLSANASSIASATAFGGAAAVSDQLLRQVQKATP
jgi:hypothetical protein